MSNERETLAPLIAFDQHRLGSFHRKILFFINNMVEQALSINVIRQIYEEIRFVGDPFEFIEMALEHLNIRYTIGREDLSAIPQSGPVIVVSNHPFGGIDGMILALVLSSIRKDIKILVNYFLMNIPDLRPLFCSVDPFGRKGSRYNNIISMGRATRWLKHGGLLVVFPAGEVSHLTWRHLKIEDPQWSNTVARLVRMTRSPILPAYFYGQNSYTFQIAGLIHPLMRTVLLPHELLKKRGVEIKLKIGNLIPYKKLDTIQDPSNLTEYLRLRTYLLGTAINGNSRLIRLPLRMRKHRRKVEKIAHALDMQSLVKEIAALAPQQKLIESRDFSVYYARANQLPKILQDIGRLREETFRLAGEGTGKSTDLDRFDNIYLHLFVWNHEKNELVGACRLGPIDLILPKYGKKGLYTHTLFKYRHGLLEGMGPALEMGRTFVRKSYQKSFSPLLLLWKGIGQYVVRNPRYIILLGAVSISNEYQSYSRKIMVTFLKMNNFLPDLSKMVKPRKPFRQKNIKGFNLKNDQLRGDNLDDLSLLISGLEEDGKGIPILLKQYVKLGGKFLCFNLDQEFHNALDGLILVDLRYTDKKVLKRYMGAEGFDTFSRFHFNTVSYQDASDSTDSYAGA
jgi:putative hemolysin